MKSFVFIFWEQIEYERYVDKLYINDFKELSIGGMSEFAHNTSFMKASKW